MRTIIRIASLYILVKQLLGGKNMEAHSREVVKTLIELSPNVEDADGISEEKSAEMDYWAMLNTIIIT